MADKPRIAKISYASRAAIGSLFKAVTLSTDPAHTLGFTASLINASRSALIYKIEQQIPDGAILPNLFSTILSFIITKWQEEGTIDAESKTILDERINKLFKSESIMRYDVQTYRDIIYCDDLHSRWKDANTTYLMNPMAWSHSNEQLADINKQLMEIITRHDLMDFPKGESFNLDEQGTAVGAIASLLAIQHNNDQATARQEGVRF